MRSDTLQNSRNLPQPGELHELDRKWLAVRHPGDDPAARIKLANDTSAIIWENVHTLPLYQRPQNWATKANLANYGSFGLGQSEWENVGFQK